MNELVSRENNLGTATWLKPSVTRRYYYGDFFIGFNGDMPVGFNDDRHVSVTCGTRGGKGTSVIIPNLVVWDGSVMVIDPKGENAIVTARGRGTGSIYAQGRGQTVWILDPFGEVRTAEDDFADLKACFNPLDLLSADREESVGIAARIAEANIVSEASSDPIWDNSSRLVLQGVTLHVATSHDFLPHERNLNTVRKLIMQGDAHAQKLAALKNPKRKAPSAFTLLFKAMQRNKALGGVIARTGAMLADLETSPRTLAGVMMTARVNTAYLDDPAMQRCVAKSDFALAGLKTDPKGMTLYLCLPQRHTETNYRWLRMMTELTLAEMERIKQEPAAGHRLLGFHSLLIVLDEFPALRRMRAIENAAAQIASYRVKLMFVTQTLAQLKAIYADNWETLLANAGVKLFFCNDDQFTREYVSKLIGECEVIPTTRNGSETKGRSNTLGFSETNGWSTGSTSGLSTSFPQGSGMSSGYSRSTTSGGSGSFSTSSSGGTSESRSSGYSESVHKRPLATPDEVGRWFGDRDKPQALVLMSGHQPLVLKRQFYYRARWLRGFFDPHPNHSPPLTLVALNQLRVKEATLAAESASREAEAARQLQEARAQKEADERARREWRILLARQEAARQWKLQQIAMRNEKIIWCCLLALIALPGLIMWSFAH